MKHPARLWLAVAAIVLPVAAWFTDSPAPTIVTATPPASTVTIPAATTTTTTTTPPPVATTPPTRATRTSTTIQATPVPPPPPRLLGIARMEAEGPTQFDCSWVREELELRGVKPWLTDWLVGIAQRESTCCPNVRGGDRVDGRCNIIGVVTYSHRSDTGVFQLNGVHWKTSAGIICPEFTCSQAVLLADVRMQFDAMLKLVSVCGQRPWTPPRYGCAPLDPYE